MIKNCHSNILHPFNSSTINVHQMNRIISPLIWHYTMIFFELTSPSYNQFILAFFQLILFWTRAMECKLTDKSWSSSNSSSRSVETSPFVSKIEMRFLASVILPSIFRECHWCQSFKLDFNNLNFCPVVWVRSDCVAEAWLLLICCSRLGMLLVFEF